MLDDAACIQGIDANLPELFSPAVGFDLGGAGMAKSSSPGGAHDYDSDADELRRLEAAMEDAPRGAVVVSGIAVGLLIVCWLLIYAFVFLPRGTVG